MEDDRGNVMRYGVKGADFTSARETKVVVWKETRGNDEGLI